MTNGAADRNEAHWARSNGARPVAPLASFLLAQRSLYDLSDEPDSLISRSGRHSNLFVVLVRIVEDRVASPSEGKEDESEGKPKHLNNTAMRSESLISDQVRKELRPGPTTNLQGTSQDTRKVRQSRY